MSLSFLCSLGGSIIIQVYKNILYEKVGSI